MLAMNQNMTSHGHRCSLYDDHAIELLKQKQNPPPHPLCKFTFLCRVAGVATPNHTACGPWVEHAQLVDI